MAVQFCALMQALLSTVPRFNTRLLQLQVTHNRFVRWINRIAIPSSHSRFQGILVLGLTLYTLPGLSQELLLAINPWVANPGKSSQPSEPVIEGSIDKTDIVFKVNVMDEFA